MENNIASLTPVEPSAVGRYLVLISYSGSPHFYASDTYGNAYLTITKAATTIKADIEEKNLVVPYDGLEHEFTAEFARITVAFDKTKNIVFLKDGVLTYSKYLNDKSTDLIGDAAQAVIELRKRNSRSENYALVDEDNPAVFTDAGTYYLRIAFLGDDYFESSSCELEFTISPAEFKNISFESLETNYIDSSEANYHEIAVRGEGLEAYLNSGAVIKYLYTSPNYVDNGALHNNIDSSATCYYSKEDGYYMLAANGDKVTYDSNPFKFNNVGTYNITASISMTNYDPASFTAKIEIKKAKMPRVIAEEKTYPYDGAFHPASFRIENNNHVSYDVYYLAGYEDVQWINYINYGGIKIYVDYTFKDDEATPSEAGEHFGVIRLYSDSYADEYVDTKVTITQYEIEDNCFANIEKMGKITSSTNLSNLYGSFTDVDGYTVGVKYVFYKENADETKGEKVELNSDGTLAPGNYIVEVLLEDDNYSYSSSMAFTVVAASKSGNGSSGSETSDGGVVGKIKQNILPIAIGGGVLVAGIIAVIVIAAIKGKKKNKKRPKKGGTPRRNGPPPKRNPEAINRHSETINRKRPEEPVKKKTKSSIEDKAQF